MITRRAFVWLLSALPPVCKAMMAYNADWDQFARELSHALADLRRSQFLIIETKRDLYYVQFAGQGSVGMRAESVSNDYLEATGDSPGRHAPNC